MKRCIAYIIQLFNMTDCEAVIAAACATVPEAANGGQWQSSAAAASSSGRHCYNISDVSNVPLKVHNEE